MLPVLVASSTVANCAAMVAPVMFSIYSPVLLLKLKTNLELSLCSVGLAESWLKNTVLAEML